MTGRQTPTSLPSRDWCQLHHAQVLAQRIRDYWADKGKIVTTNVATSIELGDRAAHCPGQVFCIRSDMVGGWPVHALNPNPTVRA